MVQYKHLSMLFTFIGGIFADKILGFKKSLFFGGMVMILGNLLIFNCSKKEMFYYGIAFLSSEQAF